MTKCPTCSQHMRLLQSESQIRVAFRYCCMCGTLVSQNGTDITVLRPAIVGFAKDNPDAPCKRLVELATLEI